MSAPPAKKTKGSSDSALQHPKIQAANKPDIEGWEKLYTEQNHANNKEKLERRRGVKYDKQKKRRGNKNKTWTKSATNMTRFSATTC